MATAKKKSKPTPDYRENEKKWGKALVDAGWQLLPNTIVKHQRELGLDPVDLNIVLQIAQYWWRSNDPPFPAIKSIADAIGKDPATVQRRLKKLERAGLIEISHRHKGHGGQTSSEYTFEGLKQAATEIAEREIAERKEEQAGRRKRGKQLKVVG